MRDDRSAHDPTWVREQRSLTQSSGAIWLIVGGLFTLIAGAVLVLLMSVDPALALAGLVIILVLYAAMIVIRLAVPGGRLRLGLLAACLLGIAAASLIVVSAVALTAWSAVGG